MSERFDYGPVQTYEITWTTGHVETIPAHQVSWPRSGRVLAMSGMACGHGPEASVDAEKVVFHAEINGHWRLVLSAVEADIRTIRNVTLTESHLIPAEGEQP